MHYVISLLLILVSAFAAADQFPVDECAVTFSPNGGTTQAIVDYINSAEKSVRVLAYNFTSQDIANALIAAHNRGVDVQLVFDKSVPTEKNSSLPTIKAAGIPYRIDHTHQIAHNKVILVDGEWFETGSFNYTDNAEYHNGENSLICHSSDGYALYLQDWQKHWSHSVTQ